MSKIRLDRRAFLGGTLALAGLGLAGCGGGGGGSSASPTPSPILGRGAVVGYRSIGSIAGIAALYAVDYRTVNALGVSITASALFGVPLAAATPGKPLPMICYFHGTTTVKTDVPTNVASLEGQALAQLGCGAGYVVVAPDYPGLGDDTSGNFQSFEQAAPLAAMAVDLLNAAQSLAHTLTITLSGRLFLTGFSEGGYAAMAVHRAIEAQPTTIGGLTVAASAPIAGPYDLSGTTFSFALAAPATSTVAEVTGLLLAYNVVYSLEASLTDIFVAPYAAMLPGLYDGTHSLGQIAAALPATVSAILNPTLLAATQSNPNAPFLVALRANNVYDWKNIAPIRLYHSPTDEEVSYQNSVVAQQHISARGGDIQLIPIGRNSDHTTSAAIAAPEVIAYFGTVG